MGQASVFVTWNLAGMIYKDLLLAAVVFPSAFELRDFLQQIAQ